VTVTSAIVASSFLSCAASEQDSSEMTALAMMVLQGRCIVFLEKFLIAIKTKSL
jgi:hypothetical protein